MGEVLAFEVSIERYFGFSASDMASVGTGVDTSVGAAVGAGVLASAGVGSAVLTGNALGVGVMGAEGLSAVDFAAAAVQKISADFSMAGACAWYARGVTWKPGMRLNDGYTVRGIEGRATCRPQEHRGAKAVSQPQEHRIQEQRGATR